MAGAYPLGIFVRNESAGLSTLLFGLWTRCRSPPLLHSPLKKRMGGFFMATINLRDYYPFYHDDAWIEISDELAREIKSWERKENNYKRKCRYHGNYSLDREDTFGTKRLPIKAIHLKPYMMHTFDIICFVPCFPACRINRPKRIYAHYFLGLSKNRDRANGGCWKSRCM